LRPPECWKDERK